MRQIGEADLMSSLGYKHCCQTEIRAFHLCGLTVHSCGKALVVGHGKQDQIAADTKGVLLPAGLLSLEQPESLIDDRTPSSDSLLAIHLTVTLPDVYLHVLSARLAIVPSGVL